MVVREKTDKGKNHRIDSILTAAEKLIEENGYSKVVISDIAKRLNLSRGIIYYYFINEHNLVAKIIANKMDKLLYMLDKIPVQQNGLDELKMIIRSFYEFLKEHSNYLSLISYFTDFNRKKVLRPGEKYQEEYNGKRDMLFNRCLQAVKKGIEDGSIYPVGDPGSITYTIWASVGSFWQHMSNDNLLKNFKKTGYRDLDKMINIYFAMISRALQNEKQL